ncbi:MAG: oxygen-independent coproporphyrinogen III oxidase [Hyphomonadaceae bacterium]|nr:MAG: oxygen-independent coproporphyrinogen III oxidase [Hyphomonadaceae bacterium]
MSVQNNQSRKLGIYIHWPYCTHICPYCDFNIYRARGQDNDSLLAAIKTELQFFAGQTKDRKLASLYFGGGTPSLIDAAQIGAIIETCNDLWGFEVNPEIVLEANPNDGEIEKFADFKSAGIERLSLGAQSFLDQGLKDLGRFHTKEKSILATEQAVKIFDRVSIDLIYARQNQSQKDWELELQIAHQLAVDHISPYQLTIEHNTSFERKAHRGSIKMPDDELSLAFWQQTQDTLAAYGFEAYEISNHARGAAAKSRHNLLYWQSQDWLGIGPGSHGRIGEREQRRATQNLKKPNEYIASVQNSGSALEIDEVLSSDDAIREHWLMGLRLLEGVTHNGDLSGINHGKLNEFTGLGLVSLSEENLALTAQGRPLSNAIIGGLLD